MDISHKILTAKDGAPILMIGIKAPYIGLGPGSEFGNSDWRAGFTIEFPEDTREFVYRVIKRMKEQNIEPYVNIYVPGESSVVFRAVLTDPKDILEISGITNKPKVHITISCGVVYDSTLQPFSDFLSLFQQDGFYNVNVIERKPGTVNKLITEVEKTVFSFPLRSWHDHETPPELIE